MIEQAIPEETARTAAAIAVRARAASRLLRTTPATLRESAIHAMAAGLEAQAPAILRANEQDLIKGREAGLTNALLDRLALTTDRLASMAHALRQIAAQPDPLGRVLTTTTRANGLEVSRVSVPLGVVLFVYESRPNVTTDAAALCLRSGNAIVLRGGREALASNVALAKVVAHACEVVGLPPHAVQMVDDPDRNLVTALLGCADEIDLVIPRGGEGLIRAVAATSRIPVIKHFKGVCHVFVHASADPEAARAIAHNAKVQRPGVCNAMETLLLDAALPAQTAKAVLAPLAASRVELRGDRITREAHPELPWVEANATDWDTEYLDLILSVATVEGVTGALHHIEVHGSGHTDAIVATDPEVVSAFLAGCDSSSVMANASTRFADGFEYGLGAEIGISTDRIHARGPMGAADLCTYKWVVRGQGQVRS